MEQVVSIPSAPAGLEMKGRGTDESATVVEHFLKLAVSLSEIILTKIVALFGLHCDSRVFVLPPSVARGAGSFCGTPVHDQCLS